MQHQDWENIVFNKKSEQLAKEENLRKHNAPGTAKFRELDSEDPPALEKVKNSTSMAIQKARQAKKMTQKDLANLLNIQASVISEYESGNATPNRQLLSKISKVLGVKIV